MYAIAKQFVMHSILHLSVVLNNIKWLIIETILWPENRLNGIKDQREEEVCDARRFLKV